jgi:hypothetical protein
VDIPAHVVQDLLRKPRQNCRDVYG